MTTSHLVITNESQEISPFPAGDHKASINRRARKHNKNETELAKMIHKRSTALERSVFFFTGGLKFRFTTAESRAKIWPIKMIRAPPVVLAVFRSKALVLLSFTHRLLLLPLFGRIYVRSFLCNTVRCVIFSFAIISLGRESWLLHFCCILDEVCLL